MKNPCFFVLIIGIAIATNACSNQGSNQKIKHFDLSENWTQSEVVLLSNIATDVEYIALETLPECLIGNHRSIEVIPLKEVLIVHERNKVMRLFNRQGKFIKNIGKLGAGPNEYEGIRDYFVDEKNNRILILGKSNNCLIYDLDGDLIKRLKLTGDFQRILGDDEGNIGLLHLVFEASQKDSANLVWLTSEGKIKSTIPLYQNRPMGIGNKGSYNVQCYWNDRILQFAEIPFDTVFQLNEENKFIPAWSIESGPKKIPIEITNNYSRFISEYNNYTMPIIILETKNYFFLTGWYQNSMYKLLCNKNSGLVQTTAISEVSPQAEEAGLNNDIDGLLPFWPKNIHENLAITCLSPIDILDMDNTQEIDALKQLKEEDNPVIMIVTLK